MRAATDGVDGFGFRFVEDVWVAPDPVGPDDVFEGLCPPHYPDVRTAVEAFVARTFGAGGADKPETSGPWKDSTDVEASVSPDDEEMADCPSGITLYV